MDLKELALIKKRYGRITAGSFDEDDVFMLLMLLRRHAAAGSAVHEFANFIAHREKDRGAIYEYLNRTKRLLDQLGKKAGRFEIKPVFDTTDIRTSFNQILQPIGLNPFDESQIEQIMICIMALLQEVHLIDGKKKPFGRLVLAHTAHKLELLGEVMILNSHFATFPVLTAPNRYIPGPAGDTPAPTILVEVSVDNRKLRFMPEVQ